MINKTLIWDRKYKRVLGYKCDNPECFIVHKTIIKYS